MIIPAYNEANRIGRVLDVVHLCKWVDDIIVVSDGSRDQTSIVANAYPRVKVVDLPYNMGKGAAMCHGVSATKAEVLMFVDADLVGLQPDHLERILLPVLASQADMCIGVFRGGRFLSDTAQRISPYISGQRAMKRELFERIPYLSEMRLGVEIAINTWAKRLKSKVVRVALKGVSNTFKEQKMGIVKGATARARMYAEIGRAFVRLHRKNKRKKTRPLI